LAIQKEKLERKILAMLLPFYSIIAYLGIQSWANKTLILYPTFRSFNSHKN